MPSPPNTTIITPPRVPILDPRTGLISREWYRFFLNLFTLTGGGNSTTTIVDLMLAPTPPTQAEIIFPDDLSPSSSEIAQLADDVQGLSLEPDYLSSEISLLSDQVSALELSRQYVDTLHLHYAKFYDTTTHTAAAINTAYALTIDTTVYNVGIELGSTTSRVYVVNPGTYNFQINFQFNKSNSTHNNAWVWFRKNGTDISYSATKYDLTGPGAFFKNILVTLAAQDYIEVVWAVDDTSISIAPVASTAFSPTGPSIALTVTEATI